MVRHNFNVSDVTVHGCGSVENQRRIEYRNLPKGSALTNGSSLYLQGFSLSSSAGVRRKPFRHLVPLDGGIIETVTEVPGSMFDMS
jgi:hypothetical protein